MNIFQRLFFVFMFAAAGVALGDGKMFSRERVPPTIPYQRALILHKEGMQTLVLQSKCEVPTNSAAARLGWVVPVPAEPQITSMDAGHASDAFRQLDLFSRPKVTRVIMPTLAYAAAAVFLLSVIALLASLASCAIRFPEWFMSRRARWATNAKWGLIISLLASIVSPSFLKARSRLSVEVIAEHHVGVYDVRVVKSDSVNDLIAWLNQNQFSFTEADEAAFDSYVKSKWCFVVAEVALSQTNSMMVADREGLAAPLMLKFPVEKPVYPLALTATQGKSTQVLIYTIAGTKLGCGERMPLKFAGKIDQQLILGSMARAENPDFIRAEDWSDGLLCKFKATLSPEEMRHDLIFKPADDDLPYREHLIRP